MILFENWNIQADEQLLARQHDHMTRTLMVTGNLPQDWEWTMLVQAGEHMDLLPLRPTQGGVGITLTAQQLALSGHYTLQLRGTCQDRVRHTNTIVAYIPPSLSGDTHWPTLPSEFTAFEARMQSYCLHPPTIAENGNWLLWNGSTYEDSGYSAVDEMLAALPNADEEAY